jgi:hypothetical protein
MMQSNRRHEGRSSCLTSFTAFLKALNSVLQVVVTAYQLLSHLK